MHIFIKNWIWPFMREAALHTLCTAVKKNCRNVGLHLLSIYCYIYIYLYMEQLTSLEHFQKDNFQILLAWHWGTISHWTDCTYIPQSLTLIYIKFNILSIQTKVYGSQAVEGMWGCLFFLLTAFYQVFLKNGSKTFSTMTASLTKSFSKDPRFSLCTHPHSVCLGAYITQDEWKECEVVTSLNGGGLVIIYTVSLERVDQKQREAIMALTCNPLKQSVPFC